MPLSVEGVGGGNRTRQPNIYTTATAEDPAPVRGLMNLVLPENDIAAFYNLFTDDAKAKELCDSSMQIKQSSKLIALFVDASPELRAVEDGW